MTSRMLWAGLLLLFLASQAVLSCILFNITITGYLYLLIVIIDKYKRICYSIDKKLIHGKKGSVIPMQKEVITKKRPVDQKRSSR